MKRQIFTLFIYLFIISFVLSSCSRYTSVGYAASYRNGKVRNVR